jgi:hypothetical protein
VEKDYSFFYFEKSLYSLSNPKSKIQNPKSLYQDVHNSNGNVMLRKYYLLLGSICEFVFVGILVIYYEINEAVIIRLLAKVLNPSIQNPKSKIQN